MPSGPRDLGGARGRSADRRRSLTLERASVIGQRCATQIATTPPEAVEGDDHRRRRRLAGVLVEQAEPGDQLLIEARYLAVEDERWRRQPADSPGDAREAGGVVTPSAAHEPDVSAVLMGDDP